ncbi:MAG TPA: outer membrane beta-barrel protein [Hyphomicrobiaceae bacterium]|nr:outer membrane beta-barrel protein [Hyphomicrobiaceae bacterium]
MKAFCATLALGAALLTGSVAVANAADLYGAPGGSIKDATPVIPYGSPMSWYIRGDIGWASHDNPVMVEDGIYDLVETKIGRNWTYGGGIGRYFSPSVRGDITVDVRTEADVRGRLADPGATAPGTRHFGLKSTVTLFNLYYDFDTRTRFTPYIGAGLGFAHLKTTTGTITDTCGCGFTSTSIATGSDWHVAGALMAGFAFTVRDRVHLDAGYRFLYLGEVATGPVTTTNALGTAMISKDPTVEDIHAHEFRLGLRMDIRSRTDTAPTPSTRRMLPADPFGRGSEDQRPDGRGRPGSLSISRSRKRTASSPPGETPRGAPVLSPDA